MYNFMNNFMNKYFKFILISTGSVVGSMTAGITYNWLEYLYSSNFVCDKKSYYSLRGHLHRDIIPLLMCFTGAITGGYLTYKKLK